MATTGFAMIEYPVLLVTIPGTGTMFTIRELGVGAMSLQGWKSEPLAFTHIRENVEQMILDWPYQILTTYRDPGKTWHTWLRRKKMHLNRGWFDYCWEQWNKLDTDWVVNLETQTAPFPISNWSPENSAWLRSY